MALTPSAAVEANKMISGKEETIRKAVGGLLALAAAANYLWHSSDLAVLATCLSVGVGVVTTGVRSQ